MNVGRLHQQFENIAKQWNRLMRRFQRSHIPTLQSATHQPEARLQDVLNDSSPRQRMDLPLPIRRSRKLRVVKHDESVVPRHMDVGFNPVCAVCASFGE